MPKYKNFELVCAMICTKDCYLTEIELRGKSESATIIKLIAAEAKVSAPTIKKWLKEMEVIV